MDIFLQYVRYGLRSLAKSPGFAAVAILTLALGIGGNTAIFSVVNSVLLQPLSYPNPDRLVELELTSKEGNGDVTSIPKFNVWLEQTQVFDSVAAYDFSGPGINLTGGDRPEQLKGIHASSAILVFARCLLRESLAGFSSVSPRESAYFWSAEYLPIVGKSFRRFSEKCGQGRCSATSKIRSRPALDSVPTALNPQHYE